MLPQEMNIRVSADSQRTTCLVQYSRWRQGYGGGIELTQEVCSFCTAAAICHSSLDRCGTVLGTLIWEKFVFRQGNGVEPVSISNKAMPTEYMSAAGPSTFLLGQRALSKLLKKDLKTSGAAKSGVNPGGTTSFIPVSYQHNLPLNPVGPVGPEANRML